MDFSEKRILVTGAGRGIGRHIALELSRAVAQVVALSRTDTHLATLKEEDGRIETVVCDVCNWQATRSVVENLGRFDGLVNNAGIMEWSDILTTTEQSFDRQFNTNVKSVWNISQTVCGGMVKAGKPGAIVNVSSVGSHTHHAEVALYGTTKAAVDYMTKAFAKEMGPHQIRVNAVNPGLVLDTGMGNAADSKIPGVKMSDLIAQQVPLRAVVEKEDVTNAVLYLLSDKAKLVTGTCLDIAGGMGL